MDLSKMPLVQFPTLMTQAAEMGDQSLLNILAYEVTTRLYIPNQDKSFEEMLRTFGYKEIEIEQEPIKKIHK